MTTRLYTLSEAGVALGVSYRTVKQYIADRELRAVNVTARSSTGTKPRLRIREDDLQKFIDRRTAA